MANFSNRFVFLSFPGGSGGKESACSIGDLGSTPDLGRSPGEGNGNSLQYSCPRIPWTEEAVGLQSMGSQRIRHDSAAKQKYKKNVRHKAVFACFHL